MECFQNSVFFRLNDPNLVIYYTPTISQFWEHKQWKEALEPMDPSKTLYHINKDVIIIDIGEFEPSKGSCWEDFLNRQKPDYCIKNKKEIGEFTRYCFVRDKQYDDSPPTGFCDGSLKYFDINTAISWAAFVPIKYNEMLGTEKFGKVLIKTGIPSSTQAEIYGAYTLLEIMEDKYPGRQIRVVCDNINVIRLLGTSLSQIEGDGRNLAQGASIVLKNFCKNKKICATWVRSHQSGDLSRRVDDDFLVQGNAKADGIAASARQHFCTGVPKGMPPIYGIEKECIPSDPSPSRLNTSISSFQKVPMTE